MQKREVEERLEQSNKNIHQLKMKLRDLNAYNNK